MTESELNGVLSRARGVQKIWAAKSLRERLRPVEALRARLARDPKTLAEVVAADIGKSRFEAIGSEVLPVADVCAFLSERAEEILAPRHETLRGTMPFAGSATVRHLPWGVVASIVPWNYPLFLCAGPALNALVAGNAIVMKPSPRAKNTVAAFARWVHEAGFPPELAPVLDSADDTGRLLAASPLIDKIVFTGSSKTGRAVLKAAAENLVPATMELSGFDAVHVLADADVQLAAAAVAFGVRLNAGRTCICPRRVFVDKRVGESFIGVLTAKLMTLDLLSPMDPQTLREADELAAKIVANGGTNLNGRQPGDQWKALLYKGGADAMRAAEGNFVPALVISEVENLNEATRLDEQSRYALGASIFSKSMKHARALADRLPPGMLAINECVAPAGEAALPFGGAHESGYGVRGGNEGLLEMTRPQSLSFARGKFRPHHLAGEEAEELVMALMRARHSGEILSRAAGWVSYGWESVKWLQKLRRKDADVKH